MCCFSIDTDTSAFSRLPFYRFVFWACRIYKVSHQDQAKRCRALSIKTRSKSGRTTVNRGRDAMQASQTYPIAFGEVVAQHMANADTSLTLALRSLKQSERDPWAGAYLDKVLHDSVGK